MKKLKNVIFILLLTILMNACSDADQSKKEGDYEATKKMVVDILQTEDGKKALVDMITDEKVKKMLVIESDVVKNAMNEMVSSEEHKEMWKKLFQDPSFVEAYAKSMNEEQQKLLKKLMSDAEYQKSMLELLQNPEITEQMLLLMKSQQFRAHLESIIQETFDNPLFQAKLADILLKVAGDESNSQTEDNSPKSEKQEGSDNKTEDDES